MRTRRRPGRRLPRRPEGPRIRLARGDMPMPRVSQVTTLRYIRQVRSLQGESKVFDSCVVWLCSVYGRESTEVDCEELKSTSHVPRIVRPRDIVT